MSGKKEKAGRNRTLSVTPDEKTFLEPLIHSLDKLKNGFERDVVVNADLLDCLDYIPNNSFDLIIIDPPYNLHKNFHGKKFSSMSNVDYEDYLRSWCTSVCDKLKNNGSLYMCGDWKCSSAMQRVIEEKL